MKTRTSLEIRGEAWEGKPEACDEACWLQVANVTAFFHFDRGRQDKQQPVRGDLGTGMGNECGRAASALLVGAEAIWHTAEYRYLGILL